MVMNSNALKPFYKAEVPVEGAVGSLEMSDKVRGMGACRFTPDSFSQSSRNPLTVTFPFGRAHERARARLCTCASMWCA
ncbi:unnamed protein product [Leuciscus chuanchicus]